MILGTVTNDSVPTVLLPVGVQTWPATIDTGFNGDLELPNSLHALVNARFLNRTLSLLAGGQIIDEDTYLVDFPFDGQTVLAEATFVSGGEILVGRILAGEGRADALRNAQLALRQKYPDPYFWGAFICQGDPGPLRS